MRTDFLGVTPTNQQQFDALVEQVMEYLLNDGSLGSIIVNTHPMVLLSALMNLTSQSAASCIDTYRMASQESVERSFVTMVRNAREALALMAAAAAPANTDKSKSDFERQLAQLIAQLQFADEAVPQS